MLTVNWEQDGYLFHWPESQRLKTALDAKKSGICYTMPGLKTDDKLASKEQSKYESFFIEHFCKISPDLNAKGLSYLLKNNQVEIALNATTVLLSQMGQGLNKIGRSSTTSEHTLALWTLRFQLLLILKLNHQVVEELAAFEDLDAPDLYYQYYPNSNKQGTMVPFALRLIHAEILRFTPLPWTSLDRISKLKENVIWVLNNLPKNHPQNALAAWKKRLLAVEKLRARLLFSLGEVKQSMEHLSSLKKDQGNEETEKLCFEMMRIALSIGDDSTSNKQLQEASGLVVNTNDLTLHKALRAVFLGAYPHAADYSQRLMKIDDKRATIPNLAAITCLYTGKVNDGVQLLSQCYKPLPEHLMTNIRSMSELGLPAAQKDTLMREIEL